ncbi:hypothetical protein [Candidatus Nitrospira neomarina]|uniref:Uncharacterized protein n=1 Tax=Candidatus Nitrospira neomarina TaxID=3020899 RepID=A0AA96GM56_9BACT|nr:hypothetical protein [Candidatus Nitrospira neomarina]WNM62980.1 hypothetical protein PQG83_04305 [Candidatus Nitrospira neomarina]
MNQILVFQLFSRCVGSLLGSVRDAGFWFLLEAGLVILVSSPVWGIVPEPSEFQILEAIKNGQEGARSQTPPNRLYWHFGISSEDVPQAHGFLMTKLNGIAVMSSHFALRGERLSSQDIQQILDEQSLQVVVMIFGDSSSFAKDSYLLLKQGDRLIKPDRIRFDARATLLNPNQGPPTYRAKIVASFNYHVFDALAQTTVKVFPGTGGEVTFDLDFASIP